MIPIGDIFKTIRKRPAVLAAGLLALLLGCNERSGEFVAASAISAQGFARDGAEVANNQGREVKVWGFVDHSNLFGDSGVKRILGDWWGGQGPNATTWRFNLKAREDDGAGASFPVYVANDPKRDELLQVFVEDARARRPTKVFVKGRLFTFQAVTSLSTLTGLYLEVQSSGDIWLAVPPED